MKRALILAALLPSAAWGQTSAAQFVPPNGLPLDTPIGTARNADGTGAVTFAAMLAGISAAVTPAQMQSALADYLTISSAASTYATPSSVAAAVQTETVRAQAAEKANADDLAALQSVSVTQSGLSRTLSEYLTEAQSDARYATPGSVSSAVQTETNRAEAAEQANAGAIVSLQSSALSKDDAVLSYLPLSGGNTTGALNGVMTFQGLVGSSASGASTVLTTDGSGAVNGTNCLQVPSGGITKAVINVIGASTNGTDAVMQVYPGIALFTASSGTPALQGTSASFYPVFGSPNPWSVVPTVDTSTKCVVITTKGSGSGSWKWRASIQYETLTR
ncbi:hypothetical protein ABHV46_10705 [Asaia sp. BMEF1]|uniref:hypothetical protein n=1 Tax=Asaia sp. BMEF1 TaxID=3155932 RepID=UPI003F66366F